MLKKIRVYLALFFFVGATLLFLDFTGTIHNWLGWIAKIQFFPALLAFNVIIVIALIVGTVLFGRIYCSIICPLGIFQDFVSWISSKIKKNRFKYSPAISWLRYCVLGLFFVIFILDINVVIALIEPYSMFGRIVSNLFAPVYQWINNLLAYFSERVDSYAFYNVDVWIKSLVTFIVAAITLILISILAWKNGRTYCNTICPVGTFLGFISKYSVLKPVINTEKCNACGLCAKNCKSSCIDSKNHSIDYSRCVTCMDCIEKCNQDAIKYISKFKIKALEVQNETVNVSELTNLGNSRRNFISIASLFLISTAFKRPNDIVEGGLAIIEDKKIPKRLTNLFPGGLNNINHFHKHCTACGLCISVCPNNILQPSDKLETLMQPEMSYEIGYCRPECTICSEVCPTGAISLITKEDKSSTKIGTAVWIKNNCVVLIDDVDCGNCARHCPAGAIEMVSADIYNPDAKQIPVVNAERCIGCGACENLCPARPYSAIYVEGIEVHRTI